MPKRHAKQLYLDFCSGDKEAGRKLVEKFTSRIFNYMRRVSVVEDVNDYVQSAWLKIFESCEKNRLQHDNAGAFMVVTAKHSAIDKIRKREAKKQTLNEEYKIEVTKFEHNDVLNPAIILELFESQQIKTKRFQKVMKELPQEQRQTLYLQLFGHSIEDIAKITDVEKEAVRSRLRYAKSKLKKLILAPDWEV
jgi:RNA polymerase sigma-70 factor (ECF subfamily)